MAPEADPADRHVPDPAAFGAISDAEPLQLLDPEGELRDGAEAHGLTDDEVLALYRWMVVVRAVDHEAINLQRQGQLGVYASCLGQEAAQVGSAAALGDGDWVFPTYRELGAAMVRGVDPASILHLYRGTWLSDHDPYEHGFALYSIPIGTQALHAVGFGLGAHLDGADTVAVAYLGDGATSEGDTHEALTFAGVMGAPVVFFVQNNQYAISVPISAQTAAPTLAHKAVGYGVAASRVDGNDVLATHLAMRHALDRAKKGGGATFIEAVTYRMEAHTTSDDPTRYRPDGELEAAGRRDPIDRLRRHLRARGVLDDGREDEVATAATRTAADVRAAVYDAPAGDPREVFEHVYVDAAGHFEDQAAELSRELEAAGQPDDPAVG